MNKAQLVGAMAEKALISKGDAQRALEAFMEITAATLKEGGKVTLTGFGTFLVEHKKSRVGRDPRNGAPIKISAKNVAKFRPGLELSELLQ